jgi:hypothetical protein
VPRRQYSGREQRGRERRQDMKKLVCGLAASSLLLGANAFAEPVQLSNPEMDSVNAGFFELDMGNTSTVAVSIWRTDGMYTPTPNTIHCNGCYLVIVTPHIAIGALFGPTTTPPTGPPEAHYP